MDASESGPSEGVRRVYLVLAPLLVAAAAWFGRARPPPELRPPPPPVEAPSPAPSASPAESADGGTPVRGTELFWLFPNMTQPAGGTE